MEVAYIYSKPRSEFGKQCRFANGETQILESILPSDEFSQDYRQRNPTTTASSTVPMMSETEVNTERVVTTSTSMLHTEGGWPKDVDPTEQSDVARYRKKAEKDEEYRYAIKTLAPIVTRCMRQNNTVNVYEEYFVGRDAPKDHGSELPSAKGVAVFRDPSPIHRTATSVDWHAEGNKIAVSYSILKFQDERLDDDRASSSSYVWDIANSNTPIIELLPPSPLTCLRFNPKSSDTLLGGSYNGLISCYDLRKAHAASNEGGCHPSVSSVIESSHHDPVAGAFWIQSKTGHLCASVSTDGRLLWWDTRNLEAPTDSLQLPEADAGEGLTLGGSSLEYSPEAGPTKYLVGTEQGIPVSINLRQRKGANSGVTVLDGRGGRHHGAIASLQRNPAHAKYFLTVGDWTARIWSEDIRTPIVTTRYSDSNVTTGCWSPTRPGVFFVGRADGVVDVWDLCQSHSEAAYNHKVGDSALSSIAVRGGAQGGGRLVAIGDVGGTVSLLEVCASLAQAQPNEKAAVGSMLDRESRRVRNLEIREREGRRARVVEEERARTEEEGRVEGRAGRDEEAERREVERQFLAMTREGSEEEQGARKAGRQAT